MRVAIHHNSEYGWVDYDSMSKEVMVTHPNTTVANTVRHYLNQDREVTVVSPGFVPKEGKIGGRVNKIITPLNSKSDLEMALVEMFHATGVHVDWGTKELQDESPDKVIAKSLFGKDEYEIIN